MNTLNRAIGRPTMWVMTTLAPQRSAHLVVAAAGGFAAVTAARFAVANPAEAVGFLYVLPTAMLATRYGARAGVAAGGIALLLSFVWAHARGVEIGLIGYSVRAAVFIGVGALVGALVRQRDALEHEARRWFAMSNDLLCVANLDGYFTRVNGTWQRVLGYPERELLGKPFLAFVHPEDRRSTEEVAAALAAPSTLVDFENRYRGRDGSWHWLLWSARSDGAQIYAVAKDITERKALEAEREQLIDQLSESARTDELTGLANRRAWNERLGDELRRAARTGQPLSVALLDLDDFKQINDAHGHAAGDRLLREAAAAWRGAVRDIDFVGRLGGDEFAILLPGCSAEEHDLVAQRLHSVMPPNSSASVGTAQWTAGETAAELLERADRELYRRKVARTAS